MMQAPIVIDDHGDLSFFSSVAAAELYLEAIDVENKEYKAYDGRGRVLRLTTTRKGRNEVVKIEPTSRFQVEHLRTQLANFLGNLSETFEKDESLEELIKRSHRLIDE